MMPNSYTYLHQLQLTAIRAVNALGLSTGALHAGDAESLESAAYHVLALIQAARTIAIATSTEVAAKVAVRTLDARTALDAVVRECANEMRRSA